MFKIKWDVIYPTNPQGIESIERGSEEEEACQEALPIDKIQIGDDSC